MVPQSGSLLCGGVTPFTGKGAGMSHSFTTTQRLQVQTLLREPCTGLKKSACQLRASQRWENAPRRLRRACLDAPYPRGQVRSRCRDPERPQSSPVHAPLGSLVL